MRLTRASDFALRILILLSKSAEPLSVDEIANRLNLPKSHVMKIVSQLAAGQFVSTQRGRAGGVRINEDSDEFTVGDIVRTIENEFAVVDCLSRSGPRCAFEPRCALKSAMQEATGAFLGILDQYSLADIVSRTQRTRSIDAK